MVILHRVTALSMIRLLVLQHFVLQKTFLFPLFHNLKYSVPSEYKHDTAFFITNLEADIANTEQKSSSCSNSYLCTWDSAKLNQKISKIRHQFLPVGVINSWTKTEINTLTTSPVPQIKIQWHSET